MPFGSLISAGASLLGGVLGRSSADKAREANLHQFNLQRADQYRFARENIRWRVEDAKAAGIHPLYALGAPSISPSASYIGERGDSYSDIGRAGQDIGRAVDALATKDQREANRKALDSHRALQQEAIKSQIRRNDAHTAYINAQAAKLNQPGNPPGLPSPTGSNNVDESLRGEKVAGHTRRGLDGFVRTIAQSYLWGRLPGPKSEQRHAPVLDRRLKEGAEELGLSMWELWAYIKTRPAGEIAPYRAPAGASWVWNNSRTYIYLKHRRSRGGGGGGGY